MGANIITGGTPSADSEYDANYSASRASDGVITGYPWSTTNTVYPHWWKYDFGASVKYIVTAFRVFPYRAVGTAYDMKNFTLQGSNDNVNWRILLTDLVPNTANPGQWESFNVLPSKVPYRYFKINGTDSWSTRNYLQIYEIELYGYSVKQNYLHARRDRMNMKGVSTQNSLA